MVNRRNKKCGFSVLEVISALVILAVVAAATAATIGPMRTKANDREAWKEISQLNAISLKFADENGHKPKSVNDLVRAGYLPISGPGAAERIRRIRRNYQYSQTSGRFSRR